MDTYVEPVYRHLKKEHNRKAVGIDLLAVTPVDEAGNTCLIVIVVFYTKYVWATPAKEYTAHIVASALFTFFCTFGIYDEFWSEVVQKLTKWMGVRRVNSLVDRHESNGVEGSNKQILRHLRTLVHDLRVPKKWSDPTILSLVLFAIKKTESIRKQEFALWMLPLAVRIVRIFGYRTPLTRPVLPAHGFVHWTKIYFMFEQCRRSFSRSW